MIGRIAARITFFILFAAAPVMAAQTPPAALSGTWSGTAKITSYKANATSGPNTTASKPPAPQRQTGTLTISFSQNASAITLQTTIVVKDKSGQTNTSTGTLAGVYGNGNFWALGVTSNANDSISIIITGHATSKSISGIGIAFGSSTESDLSYTLKPARAQENGTPAALLQNLNANVAGTRSDSPINVTGSATGKTFTISTVNKAAPVRAALTGTITANSDTASATLSFADSSGTETFTLSGFTYGNTLVLFGPNSNSTSQAVLSLHTTTKTGKGIAILYNNGAVIEAKVNVKQ